MRYAEIETRKRISRIGLGTWQFGSREWGYGKEYDATGIVRRALELGVTLFDTAELYAFGRSERILGDALGDERTEVFVASKIFPILPVSPIVQQRAVASAGRLGIACIDLYQVHKPNPVVRDRSTMRGMRTLQNIGVVAEVGVSTYSLARWQAAERALGSRVLSNQVEYSLAKLGPERELLPYARSAERLVIAYSPLAQGFLSGRYDADNPPPGAIRRTNPLFLPENLARGATLIATLREVADAHDATCSQIALAYLLHHPSVVAIPGASSVEQMERNAAAADILLEDREVTALRDAARDFRPLTGLAAAPRMVGRRRR
ncbi:MAG: aldo/keto reductase [Actinocatenispora sp.]